MTFSFIEKKAMKNYLLILFAIFLTNSAWTQNKYLDYKYSVKIYNLSSYNEETNFRMKSGFKRYDNKYVNLILLNPTIAFQWKSKKNNFKEIELTNFIFGKHTTINQLVNDSTNVNQTTYDVDQKITYVSIRYEYLLTFNKNKDNKTVFSLGFGINPYFKGDKYIPRISSEFPTTYNDYGLNLFIVPRITYHLTSKIFIELNIPVCLINSYWEYGKSDNPQLPYNQRKVNTVYFEELPINYSCRLGIGIKL
jgi:hypothetical protein